MVRAMAPILCLATLMSVATSSVAGAVERDDSNALDVYFEPQTIARLPDGRKFHFYCTGSGSPTTILDAGLGGWSISWRSIQPQIAQMTRVCAFDRAGYWYSDPGPMPRDAAAEVKDLHDGLVAAQIKPPYILIGHSYGGMTSRLFALRYSSEVVGMLLIDPSFPYSAKKTGESKKNDQAFTQYLSKCAQLARKSKLRADMADSEPGQDCINSGREDWSQKMSAKLAAFSTRAPFYDTQLSEFEGTQGRSSRELMSNSHPLGALPITVLTADEAHFNEPGTGQRRYAAWVAGHDEIAKSSTRGQNIIVEGAGHFIYLDKPDLVLSKFKEMLDSVRGTSREQVPWPPYP